MGTVTLRSNSSPDGTYSTKGSTLTFGEMDTNLTLFLRNDVSDTMNGNLTINGTLSATSKSFDIDHPSKEGMRLRYGSLEGPENGVYVRGKLKKSNTIELPDYWVDLVHEDSITVHLTPIGGPDDVWVKEIVDNKVHVGASFDDFECFYIVYGERKDIDSLVVEYTPESE